ncbi:multicopper oxidase family protein [Caldibacillus thermoamylovorans]|uniref:multicopper oxidase family protein n=1 Tax=Caldibacillus thermoamylovorans TaxID=35841 RepID=UPI001D08C39A|nr:multicopper oxidase family protein [Caldibacillus thermoamylovorans]MCB5935930.1 multicopper oxidase family protein [Bacillus sp. DFI.2.34]MCB7076843.1 multicopper oxidase family protein [Caldibacillus thermoamylovorans]
MRKITTLIIILGISLLAACTQQTIETENNSTQKSTDKSSQNVVQVKTEDTKGKKVNEINLLAQEKEWKLSADKTITAWTYNGTIPGEQIRVKQGEVVKVNLKNELEEPVSIHWHGIPVPNTQDGIPGVTQDAVVPGETYTYEFVAEDPGTYWYHSHQDGVNQLDKGMYGTIIVESAEDEKYDRDYTLVLDEWESGSHTETESQTETNGMEDMNHNDMDGMDHDSMDMENGQMMMTHDMSTYDIYTINGKTYEENEPLKVKKGETVKLRFVNAGYMAHQIHIPVEYKVTHVDGQKVNKPQFVNGSVFEVAPGERIDVEFVANGTEDFTIDCHGEMEAAADMKIDVVYEDGNGEKAKHNSTTDLVELTALGEKTESQFSLNDNFDVEYEMELGTAMDENTGMGMVWTINGKTYPDIPPIEVSEGDKVKVTLTNNSMDQADHPMHLHGHFFQVLSKNGEELKGSPIIKDTLNVKYGETYEVAFVADNPGNWLFHCHDLHHASSGMVTTVKYNNLKEFYTDTGKVDNKPE